MIKIIILLSLLLPAMLFSKEYDTTIMAIEAKLFPKIALLEQHIKQNSSKTLKIIILANEIDFDAAEEFKEKIITNYPTVIANKQIIVNISEFNPSVINNANSVIVLSHKPEKLKEIALWANKNKIVSFVYEPSNLKYGFLSSIYIGKSTKPYLNKQTILDYNFVFDSYLLQLSKISNLN
ncbi:hypothetical protein [Sulfurimonas sp.]